MKIDLEQMQDCEHCFHTFGSFGCCVTVNNEWVYSCKEGQRKYLIDRVLEIIDTTELSDKRGDAFDKGFETAVVFIREAVLDLKGE